MHRKRKSDSIIAALAVIYLVVHLIVLGGLILRGFVNALHAHGAIDVIYGVLIAALGIVFSGITYRVSAPFLKVGAWSFLKNLVSHHRYTLAPAALITILQYIFKDNFFNTLSHGGILFGGYIVGQSRLGILSLIGIDLFDYGFSLLIWVMQFYLLLLVGGWIQSVFRKKKNRS